MCHIHRTPLYRTQRTAPLNARKLRSPWQSALQREPEYADVCQFDVTCDLTRALTFWP
jgi:hypothetical protein